MVVLIGGEFTVSFDGDSERFGFRPVNVGDGSPDLGDASLDLGESFGDNITDFDGEEKSREVCGDSRPFPFKFLKETPRKGVTAEGR
jgi:hypothetical protein